MASKLDGLHPKLVEKIMRVLSAMEAEHAPMKVTDGVRTAEEQHKLWLRGRNAAGQVIDHASIVTNADGYVKKSNHQPHADGFGHAVDCCFQGTEPYSSKHPWKRYGELVVKEGLVWGGNWQHLVDQPHAELPED